MESISAVTRVYITQYIEAMLKDNNIQATVSIGDMPIIGLPPVYSCLSAPHTEEKHTVCNAAEPMGLPSAHSGLRDQYTGGKHTVCNIWQDPEKAGVTYIIDGLMSAYDKGDTSIEGIAGEIVDRYMERRVKQE